MNTVFIPALLVTVFLGSTWCSDTSMRTSYFHSEQITGNINQAVVGQTYHANSYTKCASRCSDLISAVSLYFDEGHSQCHCNKQHDINRVPDSSGSVIYAYITRLFEAAADVAGETTYYITSGTCDSCDELYASGYRLTGLYVIQASDNSSTKEIYCDLAGEWTVFQKRFDGSVDFYRNWADYVAGFGSPPNGEVWLGLESIHQLTAAGSCELLINLEAECDHPVQSSGYARYSSFSVDNATTNYALHVSGFSGNVGDSLAFYHNGREFTTYDADNDRKTGANCAVQFTGGWWYNDCHRTNINGLYLNGAHNDSFADGMEWSNPWGFHYSLLKTEMMVKCV